MIKKNYNLASDFVKKKAKSLFVKKSINLANLQCYDLNIRFCLNFILKFPRIRFQMMAFISLPNSLVQCSGPTSKVSVRLSLFAVTRVQ